MGSATRRDRSRLTTRSLAGRLVQFEATDGVALSGMLFEPRRRARGVVVWLHGTGGASVFDSARTILLAEELMRHRLAFFSFNNRGAHVVRRMRQSGKKRSFIGGMAHERIRECIADIDGALRMLRGEGHRDITLFGHSTGANKIAVYNFYKPRNPVSRYILLAGGDDTGLLYDKLGARRFRSTLARARELRNSDEFVPQSISDLPMSWRALHDMINPDGDYNVFPFLEAWGRVRLSRKPLFRHVRSIRKPTLTVYGEHDEYCFGDVPGCVRAIADAVGPKPNFEFAIMSGATHGFNGFEVELARLVAEWISL